MESLDSFAELLLGRIKKKFDNVIIVDSGSIKGTGKSTFSIKLSKKICLKIGYKYSFKLIIFNPTSRKIIEKVKTLPIGCVIHIDETTRVAYKRDFQKEFSKNLIKFINICRKFGKIVIFNNPDFWDLDKDLRNLADFRVTILKRGMAQVRGKYVNPEVDDKWLRKQSTEIIDHHIKSDPTSVDNVIGAIRKTHNYLFDLPFTELKEKEYEEYEKLSKVEELKGMIGKQDKWEIRTAACISIMLNDGLTGSEISERINKLISHYVNFCNIPNGQFYMLDDQSIRKIRQRFSKRGLKPIGNIPYIYNNNNLTKENKSSEPTPNI